MRIVVKNECSPFYGKELKVAFLTYDYIAVVGEGIKSIFEYRDVKFSFDTEFEEEIMRNKEILKIKKPKWASFYFYYVVLKALQGFIGDNQLKSIDIILDDEEEKKSNFLKKVKMAVNGLPVQIDVSGIKYRNVYDIKLLEIKPNDFLEACSQELELLTSNMRKYQYDTMNIRNAVKAVSHKGYMEIAQ